MDLRAGKTGPLSESSLARHAASQADVQLPPAMAAWIAQFPAPEQRLLKALYQRAIAKGDLKPGESDPQKLREIDSKLVARAIMAFALGLGQEDARSIIARMQRNFSEQMQAIYRLVETLRLTLEEEFLRSSLRRLKLEDVQKAAELLARADLHLDQVDLTNMKMGEQVALGVVAMVFSPVPAHSKLEGVTDPTLGQRATFAEAKGDERMALQDPLSTMRAFASSLKLEDLGDFNPERKKSPWS
ncbi:hypothetical protein J7643_19575 [bacterium]|nr:hypothetical protein [bacterium]